MNRIRSIHLFDRSIIEKRENVYSCIEFDQLERERKSVASLPSNDTQCLQTNIRISLSDPRLRVGTVKQVLLHRIGHSSLQGGSSWSGSGRFSTLPPPLPTRFGPVDHALLLSVSMVTRIACNATRDTEFKRVSGSRLGHRPTVLSNLSPPSSSPSSSLRAHSRLVVDSSQSISADSTLINEFEL